MPSILFDISEIDLDTSLFTLDEIGKLCPQRGDMRQLDGISHAHQEKGNCQYVGFKDVKDDEFWVSGHIPGRPLFPGVLMIEAAAQLSSFMMRSIYPDVDFVGFIGADKVKFRKEVNPGVRMYLLAQEVKSRPRRVICDAQGIVNGEIVFEATITGMPI